jgi:hypothetical protein
MQRNLPGSIPGSDDRSRSIPDEAADAFRPVDDGRFRLRPPRARAVQQLGAEVIEPKI